MKVLILLSNMIYFHDLTKLWAFKDDSPKGAMCKCHTLTGMLLSKSYKPTKTRKPEGSKTTYQLKC